MTPVDDLSPIEQTRTMGFDRIDPRSLWFFPSW